MKEIRFFYVPDACLQHELPIEEAMHAVKVLRLKSGDEIHLTDGCGCFYEAEVTMATTKRCLYAIKKELPQQKGWRGRIHVAMAPTKMMDRVEWFVEKATEIGIDEFSFLGCDYSERKTIKMDRIERIVVSSVKQSRKPWKPKVNPMTSFKNFIVEPHFGHKFIAHCYEEIERKDLFTMLQFPGTSFSDQEIVILIGPEGDFSTEEVALAMKSGYHCVSLGNARLRTETAALSAAMMAQLTRRMN